MCDCVDVAMGSYANTITLGWYPVMREYRDHRVNAGLSGDGICVDRCIVEQVIELWESGVRTCGSCCGHNKVPGMINVDPDDFDKALGLGFEPYVFDADPDRRDTVRTR